MDIPGCCLPSGCFPEHHDSALSFDRNGEAIYYVTHSDYARKFLNSHGAFWTDRNLRTITSTSRRFRGRYDANAMQVDLIHPAMKTQPPVGAIYGHMNPYHYAVVTMTHNFTVSVVGYARPLDITVTANHFGRLTILALDGIGNASYRVIVKDDKLDLNGRGALNLKPGLELAETVSLVAAITSPDLLGTVFVTANVIAGCPKPVNIGDLQSQYRGNDSRYLWPGTFGNQPLKPLALCNYLRAGGDPNYRDGTPLRTAAASNFAINVDMLKDFGANFAHPRNYQSGYPLHSAAVARAFISGKRLVELGAETGGISRADTETALHGLARGGRVPGRYKADTREFTDYLIPIVGRINSFNNRGFTPLMLAAHFSAVPAVEGLIAGGANLTATNDTLCQTPLHHVEDIESARALVAAHKQQGVTLASGTCNNRPQNKPRFPLHSTALDVQENLVIAEYLKEQGVPCATKHSIHAKRLCD